MAESKNSFIGSKMNKDLDERLIPNNEYRDALNVAVSRSEGSNSGALESIPGNELISYNTPSGVSATIIGFVVDESNDRVFVFKTSWGSEEDAPEDAYCAIDVFNQGSQLSQTLVHGSWLNFSTKNRINGVNLLEDLLFWTDNRNQPRKINVTTAIGDADYYHEEHQISVAKYNPYRPITIYKEEIEKVIAVDSSDDKIITVKHNSGIVPGMTVMSVDAINPAVQGVNALDYLTVESVENFPDINPPATVVTLSETPDPLIAVNDTVYFVISTMTDKSSNASWPGDPDYLEDKFVRFAYRFKFDDNEYSIFSPFTQIAFIPKQKGFYINGDQENAVNSTIVDFFENGINNIELIIPLPDSANNILNSYKIKEIDILYKESDEVAVRVLETIKTPLEGTDNVYVYSYQSKKPIKTLAQAQTTRVYDKVPVKAFSQSVSGNRIIYGNFQTKHTPPESINYNMSVQQKIGTAGSTNFIEYPNHTLKQNRNYQIGFVLSDKFGRQSDVILSTTTTTTSEAGGFNFSGSTIYADYIKDEPRGSDIPDTNFIDPSVAEWRGNELIMSVNSPIESTKNSQGAPGLYANPQSNGFDLLFSYTATIVNNVYTFAIDPNSDNTIPNVGEYLKGEYKDYVEVTSITGSGVSGNPYIITTDGQVSTWYLNDPKIPSDLPDTKFSYTLNSLGWYSYKIVVKQLEQDYYNVYLPSAVGGTDVVDESTDTDADVTFLSLINDNINKIPRDLAEVGPDQKQYRSSVSLFGRVKPTKENTNFSNEQFYPSRRADTSTSIGQSDVILKNVNDANQFIFNESSDPIVARISTQKQFGLDKSNFNTENDRFQLAVYETEPTVSVIDIFWETATSGLISDLNWDVGVGFEGPVGFQDKVWNFPESKEIGNSLTQPFFPIDLDGVALTLTNLETYTVTSPRGDVTSDFEIVQNNAGEYQIFLNTVYTFVNDSHTQDVFTFEIQINDSNEDSLWNTVTLSFTEKLNNVVPNYNPINSGGLVPYYYWNGTWIAGQEIHNFGPYENNQRINGDYSSDNQPGDTLYPPNYTGLSWEIMSGNDEGYFNLDRTTGLITLTEAGLDAGIGTYCIDLKLTDATDENNDPIPADEVDDPIYGSLSVTKQVCLIKGYPPINNPGVGEGFGSSTFANGGCDDCGPSTNTPNVIAYYSAAGELTNDDLPEGITATEFYRISDQLTRGQMLVNYVSFLEVNDLTSECCSGSDPQGYDWTGTVSFSTFYRENPESDWVSATDLNNYPSGFFQELRNRDTGAGGTLIRNCNRFLAFEKPGEYLYMAYPVVGGNQFGFGAFDVYVQSDVVVDDLHHLQDPSNPLPTPPTNSQEYAAGVFELKGTMLINDHFGLSAGQLILGCITPDPAGFIYTCSTSGVPTGGVAISIGDYYEVQSCPGSGGTGTFYCNGPTITDGQYIIAISNKAAGESTVNDWVISDSPPQTTDLLGSDDPTCGKPMPENSVVLYSSSKLPEYAELFFTDPELVFVYAPTTPGKYFQITKEDDNVIFFNSVNNQLVQGQFTANPVIDAVGNKLLTSTFSDRPEYAIGSVFATDPDTGASECFTPWYENPPNRY